MLNLNQNDIDIETLKDEVIKYLLHEQQKLGTIATDAEYETEYTRLSTAIKGKTTVMTLRPQSGKTNVDDFNDTLQEVYIDLLTAFQQMNAVASTIDQHRKLNNAIISNIKTNLSKLEDEITILEDRFANLSSDLIYVENFRSTDSFETDTSLYDTGDRVSFDKYNECIKLPKLVSINKLLTTNGQKMAIMSINKQLGSGLISLKNPNNGLEKAIDTDTESYWEETIMSDTPIKVELDEIKYFKVGFGAVCELEITFNNMVDVNEISLMPFGQFPIELVAIRHYTTDQPDTEEEELIETYGNLEKIEIVSPKKTDPMLQNKIIRESMSFQFPSVPVKKLRIILNQMHYIKNSFVYDKTENDKNNIWFSKGADVNFNFNGVNKGLYEDKAITGNSWVQFNKKIEESGGKIDIEEMLFPKTTNLIPVTKYEYNYGLYNLAITENNYKDSCSYISKLIKFDINLGGVLLEVDEYIPSADYGINYYVTYQDSPTETDWIPITPGVLKDFRSLMAGGTLSAITTKEKFFGALAAVLTLNHTPYIDFSGATIPNPVIVTVTDNTGATLTTENVTDYYNPASSFNNFTKSSPNIQYYIYNNKIYFGRTLSKEYIIEIDYSHFIDSVRFKAELYRGANSSNGISPVLNGYKLQFKTIQ